MCESPVSASCSAPRRSVPAREGGGSHRWGARARAVRAMLVAMKALAPLPYANLAPNTFVFGDLVGWTALTAEHGDEHGAELAIGFRRRAGLLLPGHRAQEIKAMGDGIMLRCDDPARAVRLGLRLVGCTDLPVRLGIHAGPALERDGD